MESFVDLAHLVVEFAVHCRSFHTHFTFAGNFINTMQNNKDRQGCTNLSANTLTRNTNKYQLCNKNGNKLFLILKLH